MKIYDDVWRKKNKAKKFCSAKFIDIFELKKILKKTVHDWKNKKTHKKIYDTTVNLFKLFWVSVFLLKIYKVLSMFEWMKYSKKTGTRINKFEEI